MKEKLDSKKRKIIFIFIITLSIICILYSLINILKWFLDNNNIKEEMEQIEKDVTITEVPDIQITNNIEITTDENNNMSYLEADFSKLMQTNKEVVAWIRVPNTNINYPIVQHIDNTYYLNHSFTRDTNDAGWVFMDYRNSIYDIGKNTIIYAHTRKDGSMFGTLENTLNSNWYENKDNYIIKLSTLTENTLWEIFSIYRIPTTSDYIQTDFPDNNSFQKFLDTIKERSIYNFETTPGIQDKVLTLSTCHNKNERIVMHAKLIKSQKRL